MLTDFYCVMTFHSTYHALNFEKVLQQNNYKVRLMPIPRQVSSSCGTAAEFPCDKKEEILRICNENHIEVDETHEIRHDKKKHWFIELMNG